MRTLKVFESITTNGFFAGPGGDLSWAHAASGDPEFQAFVKGNASSSGVLLFGRVTYEMMASYWPSPLAETNDPVVARGMNAAEKIVFSRTLEKAEWSNTTVIRDDLASAVKALKEKDGAPLVVLGSGSIVTQLADANLVDEYQLVVKSVALGSGRSLFEGAKRRIELRLTGSRVFGADNVVLTYEPKT